MIGLRPPFAIATPTFRFRALASHAGRAALGGDREVALACFAAARLGAGMLPPFMLAPGDAAARAMSTRNWLASLALPGPARAALNATIDAMASGNRKASGHALTGLLTVVAPQLDQLSATELRELADELSDGVRQV
ncbi:MAG: hypothetical protein Q7S20_05325 [Gemmatimonadaceae bacterium]|nr:hypothetical protein [Gemmatimonadaceae bacterium]